MFRLFAFVCAVLLVSSSSADFVLFNGVRFISESGKKIPAIIEGRINTNTNTAMLLVNHPVYGQFYLPKDQCKVIKSVNQIEDHRAEIKNAAKKQDLDELWKLAKQSVRFGLPGNYFKAAEMVIANDPNHKEAQQAIRLMELIDEEIPESKKEEQELMHQCQVTLPTNAKFGRSQHFLVMHDTKPHKIKAGKKVLPPLIDQRLETLEKVYRSFFAYFWSRGYELMPPKKRLYVVLFDQESDFREAARAIGIKSSSVVGFYSLERDVSYFFEFRGTPSFRETKKECDELRAIGKNKNILNRGDFIRLANALDVLMEDQCEKEDVSTISHEAVHHLCHASGLMPNGHGTPRWAAEGMGTFFESSKATGWTGIGGVSEERLEFYRSSASAVKSHGGIDFVINDDIFSLAQGDGGVFAAYGHSWGLTHYLMDQHFDKLMKYYKRFADGPKVGFIPLRPEVYKKHFDECFPPSQRQQLQAGYERYMTTLKTDFEKAGSNFTLFGDD